MAIITYENQLIKFNGNKSSVLAIVAHGLKKIRLDVNTLNQAKVFGAYHISPDEKIIAYCKSGISLFGITFSGCIFTDVACYPHPYRETSLDSNRIPYSELCNYIITQNGSKGAVVLQDAVGEHEIVSSTLIRKNTMGEEIGIILTAIQDECMLRDRTAVEQMDRMSVWLYAAARDEMRIGVLSARIRLCLNSLGKKERYCDNSTILLAENIFRRCDTLEYENFLKSLPQNLSEQMREVVSQIPKEFSTRLLNDLINIELKMSAAYLDTVYKNIKRQDLTSPLYDSVKICVCARQNRHNEARENIEVFKRKYGAEAAYLLEDFTFIHGNIQMQKVYDLLSEGQALSEEHYGLVDGLGLSPLHYALIMGLDESAKNISIKGEWHNPPAYVPDGQLNMIWAYTLLAQLKESESMPFVFLNTVETLKALADEEFALENQMKEGQKLLEELNRNIYEGNRMLSKLEADPAYHPEEQDVRQGLAEQRELLYETLAMLRESEDRIRDIKREANVQYKKELTQVRVAVEKLKRMQNPLVDFLFALYENSSDQENLDSLHTTLRTTKEFRMYTCGKFSILLPDCIDIDLPYRTLRFTATGIEDDQMERDGVQQFIRMGSHDGSWFTERARTSSKLLKEEYHALAKRYHPDVSTETNAAEFFKAINEEYETILKDME